MQLVNNPGLVPGFFYDFLTFSVSISFAAIPNYRYLYPII